MPAILLRLDAEAGQRAASPQCSVALHLRVEAAAMAVHGDHQWAEALHAKLPQRLRIEVVEIHVLDRLDPGGFQGGSAAHDGEIGTAELPEGGGGAFAHAALADDEAHAVLHHEG